jgi:imidazolonepropionase-like amidohydrolase
MRLRREWRTGCAAAAAVGTLATWSASAGAQYELRQRPGMSTTDDPRRVPIHPRDETNAPVLVLRGGTLIDGTGAEPVPNALVIIRGRHVVAAGPVGKVAVPPNASRTIDTTGLYMLPGLIDLHMHFTQQRGDDFERYRESPAAAAIRGTVLAGQFLDGGITAVRDVGTVDDVALKMKEAVQRRIVQGPRVFWAGKLIASRGGHADEITETGSGRPRSLESSGHIRVANGPGDWRLAVREQIRMGADLIKLTAPFTRDEVAAAVDEAHMLGIRVTADAFGDYVTWGAEAGIDGIEHPLAIPDRAIKTMAEKGTALVPTLTAFYNVLTTGYPSAHIPAGFYYTMSRRFSMTHEMNVDSVRKARAAGVRIGVGTDIPFENEKRYPSDYFVELKLLKDAGLTDTELVAAATRVGAEILDMADKLGTIEPGKLADVLVVSANPLLDVQNLRSMKLVIADGVVVRDRLARAAPSEP